MIFRHVDHAVGGLAQRAKPVLMRADVAALGGYAKHIARESSLCILTLRRAGQAQPGDTRLRLAITPRNAARDPQSKENGFPIGGPFNAFAEGSVPGGHRLPKAPK